MNGLLRRGACCEQFGLDPVRVRLAAPLSERVPQLRLGYLLPRRKAERGQVPAHPSPSRDPGFLPGGPQRSTGRAAAVADDGLAQVVAARLPARMTLFFNVMQIRPHRSDLQGKGGQREVPSGGISGRYFFSGARRAGSGPGPDGIVTTPWQSSHHDPATSSSTTEHCPASNGTKTAERAPPTAVPGTRRGRHAARRRPLRRRGSPASLTCQHEAAGPAGKPGRIGTRGSGARVV